MSRFVALLCGWLRSRNRCGFQCVSTVDTLLSKQKKGICCCCPRDSCAVCVASECTFEILKAISVSLAEHWSSERFASQIIKKQTQKKWIGKKNDQNSSSSRFLFARLDKTVHAVAGAQSTMTRDRIAVGARVLRCSCAPSSNGQFARAERACHGLWSLFTLLYNCHRKLPFVWRDLPCSVVS